MYDPMPSNSVYVQRTGALYVTIHHLTQKDLPEGIILISWSCIWIQGLSNNCWCDSNCTPICKPWHPC